MRNILCEPRGLARAHQFGGACTEIPCLWTAPFIAHMSRFRCKSCERSYTSQYALDNHLRSLMHTPKYPCEKCEASFVTQSFLEHHVLSVHPSKHHCDKCDTQFESLDSLSQHRSTVHNIRFDHEAVPWSSVSQKNPNPHGQRTTNHKHHCGKCGLVFGTRVNLRRHLRSTAHAMRFLYEECGKCFINKAVFDKHMSSTHSPEFCCETCDKSFLDQVALDQHLPAHLVTFYCDECGLGFRDYEALEVHYTDMHSFCEGCRKVIPGQFSLAEHVQSCINSLKFGGGGWQYRVVWNL